MTTDKTPELERIAKNFSESFVDTVTAQIGANAHDPKLFVQTLMRKMILQALREATAPLVGENERVKKERDEAVVVMEAWHEQFGTTQLTHAVSQLNQAIKERDQLRAENERLKKEHDEDLTLICATQEGRVTPNDGAMP